MRKLAFGYSTRCNIRCEHCVTVEDIPDSTKMDHTRAKEIMVEMAQAGVGGISFSAGEPFLYVYEMTELLKLCKQVGIYTSMVTNSYWAKKAEASERLVAELKEHGLCQLRLSYSRWHQKSIDRNNVLNAARSCQKIGLNYFVSFITDFSTVDDPYEQFLRDQRLMFSLNPLFMPAGPHLSNAGI